MRHYPTDLLLAVEHVERSLASGQLAQLEERLRQASVADPLRRFDSGQLFEGLDRLLGGVCQYPWQPLTDTNDVLESRPVGTVVLDDRQAEATLRGLLLAWALGNRVTVRSARPELWHEVMEVLREAGVPLPAGKVTGPGTDAPVDPLEVPALPADADLAVDCQAAWAHRLVNRRHLPGVSLAHVRSQDTDRRAGRLAARIRYLAARARRTPYYRELPDVTEDADITRLPVLEKSALEAHSLPASRDLSSGDPATGEVLRSGATSGEPRYIVYSRSDWENMVREAVPMLYALGVEPGDRIVNTLFGGGMYGGLTTTFSELSRMPVESYSTAQFVTVEDLLMLTERFDANVLLGMPALILPLLRDAKKRRPGLRIEKVIYGGTPMTETDKTWLRQELGARVVSSILAANDGAQLGYQCGFLGKTVHHVNDDYNLIEVVDETGRPVADGTAGELLITGLQKFEGPLIRYRIGDMGRTFEHHCACGVSGRVLEYLGRSDGLVRFKGETVLYGEVFDALAAFRVSQLQIEVSTEGSREILTVRTEAPCPPDAGAVRELLVKEFPVMGGYQDFDSALDAYELRIECLAEGGLPRNSVSGKVKNVIDRRLDVVL
ncbi:phenylacetate--CoA ligase family protein [Streptomyces antarcticus]|uniref:phenylacetate--CoA ligase family protein n=1 Tax=Streptomyces antarcticus TaxID=2996458 RepID=UPI00226F2287|nr:MULTISPECIES: phenylacetate--CoA ligase family protein [unclassified Streptomyces]MCY0946622.1 phenylacetate--CoA ligase family protein [Streptomyces sp. H34-AA3]MCZ4085686.1 phenylacetate--CoA ligase family protein [Streptomyces sp. H34-S5]